MSEQLDKLNAATADLTASNAALTQAIADLPGRLPEAENLGPATEAVAAVATNLKTAAETLNAINPAPAPEKPPA